MGGGKVGDKARLVRVELWNVRLVVEEASESSCQKLLAGVSVCETLDVDLRLMVVLG